VGVAKEWYDRWLGPTRYFSVNDLVADALGLLLGAGVVLL
jgi:VanZ family protein